MSFISVVCIFKKPLLENFVKSLILVKKKQKKSLLLQFQIFHRDWHRELSRVLSETILMNRYNGINSLNEFVLESWLRPIIICRTLLIFQCVPKNKTWHFSEYSSHHDVVWVCCSPSLFRIQGQTTGSIQLS